jgi:hypothetical protein
MAINAKNKNIDAITYVDDIEGSGILQRYRIARVYKNNNLLWEYSGNSNFYSADNYIIVTADGYVFNSKKTID